ncbi:MAG: T9SS type A sorting domain-containing protein [Bacteroidota bacterium]|nr:T9SS type A sorting domain-containing protein [Bacteroidota bacterium]
MNPTLRLNVKAILAFFLLLNTAQSFSQSTGFINQQATSVGGRLILDPNSDGYTSSTNAGFGLDDVANSEIPYKLVKSYSIEPFGDLRRGPSHMFSDFVPDGNYVGFYTFFTGTNLLFRLRMGSVMSGSKGYSILLDTDGKFGATGPNADPNYQAATTGTNGNPGFEIEIVLETNFRLAIYNVDGTSSPTLVKAYTLWQDYSQVSIAASFDNGDPDFFRDFFIPFSDLQAAPFNLTTSSPIRMVPTTVMSPQGAIGGPKSDIYGLNDDSYPNSNDQYEAFINAQPTFTFTNLTSGGSGIGSICTAAPTVNSPVTAGTVNIGGTWTKSSLTGAAGTATITVYKNGVSIGTVSGVLSGAAWTLNSIALANTDIITAKAQATGESMCLVSNAVIANNCNSSNRPARPILTCPSGTKGFSGTNLSSGWTINVDNITRGVNNNSVLNSGSLFSNYVGASPNITWDYSGGCSSGAPLTSGSYKIYYVDNVSGCVSEPEYFCAAGNGGNALAGSLVAPVITSPANAIFTTGTTIITGTTDVNASVTLYINGAVRGTTTANGSGVFSFSNLALSVGQQLFITVELNTGIVGTSKCAAQSIIYTVSCYTKPPLINADNNNQITAGAPITGTSSEPAGTVIRVYTATPTLIATTTVQANGTWSTGNAGTTPATYNAVAATSYYANAQNGTCSVSQNSGTLTAASLTSAGRCGTITGSIAANATSISGTVTGTFTTTTINLYLDASLIGSTNTTTTNWGPITVNSTMNNTLYSNGVLTIGIQESSKQEVSCPGSASSISCSPTPTAPIITPTSSTVVVNQSITYTISNAVTGTFYGIANGTTGESLATGIWATANGNLNITTKTFTSAGNFNIVVKATSLSGVSVCTSGPAAASVTVSSTLPVTLQSFNGKWTGESVLLSWKTSTETNSSHFELERSADGISFSRLASIGAAGTSFSELTYTYTDINPLTATGFYRLKQVDIDGRYTFSQVLLLQKNNSGILINAVRPNPFSGEIVISIVLDKAQDINARLTDLSGRLIKTIRQQGQFGLNQVRLSGLQSLSGSLYIVEIETGGQLIRQKVLKANQ